MTTILKITAGKFVLSAPRHHGIIQNYGKLQCSSLNPSCDNNSLVNKRLIGKKESASILMSIWIFLVMMCPRILQSHYAPCIKLEEDVTDSPS